MYAIVQNAHSTCSSWYLFLIQSHYLSVVAFFSPARPHSYAAMTTPTLFLDAEIQKYAYSGLCSTNDSGIETAQSLFKSSVCPPLCVVGALRFNMRTVQRCLAEFVFPSTGNFRVNCPGM